MRYGKMPHKYGRIGDRNQTLPPEVERELEQARIQAAAWVEAKLAAEVVQLAEAA